MKITEMNNFLDLYENFLCVTSALHRDLNQIIKRSSVKISALTSGEPKKYGFVFEGEDCKNAVRSAAITNYEIIKDTLLVYCSHEILELKGLP